MSRPHGAIATIGLLILSGCALQQQSNSTPPQVSQSVMKERDTLELFQVIINCHDLNRQVHFYRDVMGFDVLFPQDTEDFSESSFVRLRTSGALIALHAGRTTKNAGDEPRLSFMTDDLEAMRTHLLSQDIWVDVIRSPVPGVFVADARDPEGNAFHLETHTDEDLLK